MTVSEFPEVELALITTAVSGDAGGLYRIASDLMEEGAPFESVLFDYLLGVERSVGQRWAQGDYLIAEEHAITAAIETVISLLAGMFDHPAGAPSIVIATAEGDDHSLPARAVAAHLLSVGYRTTFLGSSIPADDLHEFIAAESPAVVVLSGAISTHLLGARAVIEAAHRAGVPVVVGGNAFGPDGRWAAAVGADGHVSSMRDVATVVNEWVTDGVPNLSSLPPIPDSLSELLAARPSVVADAAASLAGDGQRLETEAQLLIDALASSLLTGDAQPVADMLAWQEESLTARGLDASRVVRAVSGALGDLDEAKELLLGAVDQLTS